MNLVPELQKNLIELSKLRKSWNPLNWFKYMALLRKTSKLIIGDLKSARAKCDIRAIRKAD